MWVLRQTCERSKRPGSLGIEYAQSPDRRLSDTGTFILKQGLQWPEGNLVPSPTNRTCGKPPHFSRVMLQRCNQCLSETLTLQIARIAQEPHGLRHHGR